MKNLENYGVLEMNAREIRETDGGIIPLLLIGAAYAVEFVCYALAADLLLNVNTYAKYLEEKCN